MLDRAEPNLLRDEFPYSRIPPIRFVADAVPQALPADTWITDTTFRDGQQARAPYSVEQIVHLYDLLNQLGGPVIRQTEFFAYTPLDREAEDYGKVVRAVIQTGLRPRCHLEDLTRADLDGFVAPLVESLQEIGREANIPVKFRLCDTMGFGLPWPEAALPRGVPRLVQYFTRTLGAAPELLEWHGHTG